MQELDCNGNHREKDGVRQHHSLWMGGINGRSKKVMINRPKVIQMRQRLIGRSLGLNRLQTNDLLEEYRLFKKGKVIEMKPRDAQQPVFRSEPKRVIKVDFKRDKWANGISGVQKLNGLLIPKEE